MHFLSELWLILLTFYLLSHSLLSTHQLGWVKQILFSLCPYVCLSLCEKTEDYWSSDLESYISILPNPTPTCQKYQLASQQCSKCSISLGWGWLPAVLCSWRTRDLELICICVIRLLFNDGRPCPCSVPSTGHLFRYVTNQPPKANSAFHPSGVGK